MVPIYILPLFAVINSMLLIINYFTIVTEEEEEEEEEEENEKEKEKEKEKGKEKKKLRLASD